MPRSLKVFRTHLGFYDAIVAAPSRKAALEAWGVGPQVFAQGFAAETNDAKAVAAALVQPGAVLRRPFGSNGEFKAHAAKPKVPSISAAEKRDLADSARERKRQRKASAAAKAANARRLEQDEKARVLEKRRQADKSARAEADKKAQADAKARDARRKQAIKEYAAELADIERAEKQLRDRRFALEKKFRQIRSL